MVGKKVYVMVFLYLILFMSTVFSVKIDDAYPYGVDGHRINNNVVIKNDRRPIFHWKFSGIVEMYEIKIATFSAGLNTGTTIWYVIGTTNTINTINDITRVEGPGNLVAGNTYYWKITLHGSTGDTDSKTGSFSIVPSAVNLAKEVLDLGVDYNNPFCPNNGEITKFRYIVKDKDYPVQLYIFTISGKYITTLANHPAIKDVLYTKDWDGKDASGNILPEGLYVIVLNSGDNPPVSKFVGIINKR